MVYDSIRTAVHITAVLVATSAQAQSNDPFQGLNGLWEGSGKVNLGEGNVEAIKCKNTYTGSGLKRKLRMNCASPGFSFGAEADVDLTGNMLKGTWKETTHGNSGKLHGSAFPGSLTADIVGDHVKAVVTITTKGDTQKIFVAPQSESVRSIDVTLKRKTAH